MRKVVLLLALAAVIVSLSACSKKSGTGTAGGKQIKVAVLAPSASAFWKIVEAGAMKSAKEQNVSCEVIAPSIAGVGEQKRRLEDLMARGVSGIAVAPVAPKDQKELINKIAAQVPVICTDTDAPDSDRVCYVGTSNYDAGKLAGEQIKKALPNGGKIWVCVGMLDVQNAQDRYKGICDTVKGTQIKILGVLTDNVDRAKAKGNVEDAMAKTKDIAAFVGLWSYNGPMIADAVKGAGKQGKIKIICFDEDAATLQGVRDGIIEATVVQNPYKFGYEAVRVLAQLARKQDAKIPASKAIDTGARVVDKSNVDAFEAEFKKLTGE